MMSRLGKDALAGYMCGPKKMFGSVLFIVGRIRRHRAHVVRKEEIRGPGGVELEHMACGSHDTVLWKGAGDSRV